MTTATVTTSMHGNVKTFIQRNPLSSMYLIMFILAWSVMIPQMLYSQGILAKPLPEFLEILVGWAPGIAALVVSGILAGRAGVRDLLRRFLIWRLTATGVSNREKLGKRD